MTILLQAGQLTLWGIAILLCWTASLRLVNMGHVALASRGHIGAPRHVMARVNWWSDLGISLAALAAGNATLIAFAGTAVNALHVPLWVVPGGLWPWLQLVRLAFALCVLLFFLTRVAENPRYKLLWAAGWGAFSLAVVILA